MAATITVHPDRRKRAPPRAVVVLRIPRELKAQLDEQRARGIMINGFITHLLEREFERHPAAGQRGSKR